MIKAAYHFPTGFLWGSATAAHQVEGQNNNNSWSQWEQQEGRILNGDKAGLAADWWGGRWKEDLDRAAESGQNAHRLSIEWSRIQPEAERWDEDALEHYRSIVRGALQRGLTPMITLHHFTDPIWLAEQGGWENESTPEKFEAFTRRAVEALKEYCNLWVPINEPNVYMLNGYLAGAFPPGKKDQKAALGVYANMVRGHARAYHAIHEIQKTARVGSAINYRSALGEHKGLSLDGWVAGIQNKIFNDAFPNALRTGKLDMLIQKTDIPEAVGTMDFLGINYYTRDLVTFNLFKPGDFYSTRRFPPEAELSANGFIANVPEGFYEALKWGSRMGLPMFVTENGIEDAGDELRPRYIMQHIHQLWRGVNMSWPVKGYFHWSLVDNFEWERGWTQRFGLWGVELETQRRIRRTSVDVYEAICRENGITTEMVDQYTPEVFKKIFPA